MRKFHLIEIIVSLAILAVLAGLVYRFILVIKKWDNLKTEITELGWLNTSAIVICVLLFLWAIKKITSSN